MKERETSVHTLNYHSHTAEKAKVEEKTLKAAREK